MSKSKFLALDFETANYDSDSACQIGLVRVENHKIVEKVSHYIKPPSNHFIFSYIHGITYKEVAKSPSFKDLWKEIKDLFEDIDFVVAHNVSFDKKVLQSCCDTSRIKLPKLEYRCTMKLSRDLWNLRPTKLSDVCSHFKIKLNHHEALSDSLACAQIMIHAEKHMNQTSTGVAKKASIEKSISNKALMSNSLKKSPAKIISRKKSPIKEIGL